MSMRRCVGTIERCEGRPCHRERLQRACQHVGPRLIPTKPLTSFQPGEDLNISRSRLIPIAQSALLPPFKQIKRIGEVDKISEFGKDVVVNAKRRGVLSRCARKHGPKR